MQPLKVRSLVGLIPLLAVETIEPDLLDALPEFKERLDWFLDQPARAGAASSRAGTSQGMGERRLLALVRGHRMKRLLARMLDPDEFLSDHGVRSLSRYHRDHPYTIEAGGSTYTVRLRAGRVDERPLRRQLELARADLVPDQLPADRGAAEVPPLLRRRFPGRVPDRLGPAC